MVFGGLSFSEFETIIKFLDNYKISYIAGGDNQFIISNNELMKDDIKYLKGSTLSAHVYSLTIEDNVLDSIEIEQKQMLNHLGLHWGEEPEFGDDTLSQAPLHPQMMMKTRRDATFGKTYRIVISIGAFIYLCIIIYKLFNKK